jgi:hypothetical protein
VELSLEILGFLLAFLSLVTGSGPEILLWELLAGSVIVKKIILFLLQKFFLTQLIYGIFNDH